uniref:Uncharacterized protein n=1 Tax=Oryza meridionalis TaxID=40149 RepID=A0A0E0FAX7_9ORYZ
MEIRRKATTRGAVRTKQRWLAVGDARKCSTRASRRPVVLGSLNGDGGSTVLPPLPPTSSSGRGASQC